MRPAEARRSGLVAALSLVCACGGGGSAPNGTSLSDAGPDAGFADANATGGHPLGGVCQTDADCQSGDCDTTFTGGSCVTSCADGACPTGAACLSGATCVVTCTTTSDCRQGFLCSAVEGLPAGALTCVPSCTRSSDCVPDEVCEEGRCVAVTDGGHDAGVPSTIGTACSEDSQCGTGTCVPASQGFPGGYCTQICTTDADCGGAGSCVPNIAMSATGSISICLAGCTEASQCRSGYVCGQNQNPTYCLPGCATRNECTVGEVCNLQTGLCDATEGDGGSADGGGSGLPAPPQVVDAMGPVLSSPELVPIFFSNDSDSEVTIPTMTAFYDGIGHSMYWAALQEYGILAPSGVLPTMLTEAAPATIDDSGPGSQLQLWLQSEITAGSVPIPGKGTLYVINYPASTTVTANGAMSCLYFGGYHADMQLTDGSPVAYAVIPRCTGQQFGVSLTNLQTATAAASHELIEAATDPYPLFNPAWSHVDAAHIFWDEAQGGSEIGDMCELNAGSFYQFADFGYTVQRFWSNAAALQGADPCAPAVPGGAFFNTVPDLQSRASFVYDGIDYTIDAASIPVGTTGTTTLDLYSDGSTSGPWTVQVQDLASLEGLPPLLSFVLPVASGQSGDQLQLGVTVNSPGDPGSNGEVTNTEAFLITSTLGSETQLWWGVVVNP